MYLWPWSCFWGYHGYCPYLAASVWVSVLLEFHTHRTYFGMSSKYCPSLVPVIHVLDYVMCKGWQWGALPRGMLCCCLLELLTNPVFGVPDCFPLYKLEWSVPLTASWGCFGVCLFASCTYDCYNIDQYNYSGRRNGAWNKMRFVKPLLCVNFCNIDPRV